MNFKTKKNWKGVILGFMVNSRMDADPFQIKDEWLFLGYYFLLFYK